MTLTFNECTFILCMETPHRGLRPGPLGGPWCLPWRRPSCIALQRCQPSPRRSNSWVPAPLARWSQISTRGRLAWPDSRGDSRDRREGTAWRSPCSAGTECGWSPRSKICAYPVEEISRIKFCPDLKYWADQKNLVKGCRQTLDCYCVSCELLSACIADALLFVNILV